MVSLLVVMFRWPGNYYWSCIKRVEIEVLAMVWLVGAFGCNDCIDMVLLWNKCGRINQIPILVVVLQSIATM